MSMPNKGCWNYVTTVPMISLVMFYVMEVLMRQSRARKDNRKDLNESLSASRSREENLISSNIGGYVAIVITVDFEDIMTVIVSLLCLSRGFWTVNSKNFGHELQETLEIGRRYLVQGTAILGVPEVRDDATSVAKAVLAEFLGTTLVVFVLTGSILASSDDFRVAVSLSLGFVVAAMVYVSAEVSGGHFSPAFTIAHLIAYRTSVLKAILYITVQSIGGIAGGAITQGLSGKMMPDSGFNKTVTLPHDLNDGQALGVEIVGATVVTLTFLAAGHQSRRHGNSGLGPLLIGLSFAAVHFAFMSYTGPGLNPARSFGPAVLTGIWSHHWIYWVGPLLGSIIASLLFLFVFKPREPEVVESEIAHLPPPEPVEVPDSPKENPPPPAPVEIPVAPPATVVAGGPEEIEIPTYALGEGATTAIEVHREVEIR